MANNNSERGKLHQATGGLGERDNQSMGKAGGGTPTRRRRIDANGTKSGGINEATTGRKGGRGFTGS